MCCHWLVAAICHEKEKYKCPVFVPQSQLELADAQIAKVEAVEIARAPFDARAFLGLGRASAFRSVAHLLGGQYDRVRAAQQTGGAARL